MLINKKLFDFLSSSATISNSTIILTDLNKIIFIASENENFNSYLDKPISYDLKNILNLLFYDVSSINYVNSNMNFIVPIISDINFSIYKSQIILPIVHHGLVDGLLIFMAKDRYYIKSNLSFAKTTKHFSELLS